MDYAEEAHRSCIAASVAWSAIAAPIASADAVELNSTYAANKTYGAGPADSVKFIDRTATSNLIIIAPHAVKHWRGGAPKVADIYTGGIGEEVANRLGASFLAPTGPITDWSENWGTRNDEFKRILDGLPKEVTGISLHGMKATPTEAQLGTGSKAYPTENRYITGLFKEFPNMEVNQQFSGSAAYTDTNYMHLLGHPAMQLELSATLRTRQTAQATADRLVRALSDPEEATQPGGSAETKPDEKPAVDDPTLPPEEQNPPLPEVPPAPAPSRMGGSLGSL